MTDLEGELNLSNLYPYALRFIILQRFLKLFQEFNILYVYFSVVIFL